MPEKGQPMRFTDDELKLVKSAFQDNERLLKLLRKVFLPEFDPHAPLGQAFDLWMTIDVRNLDPQAAMVKLLARNELITHVEQQLLQLQFLANMKAETPEEKTSREKANSSK